MRLFNLNIRNITSATVSVYENNEKYIVTVYFDEATE